MSDMNPEEAVRAAQRRQKLESLAKARKVKAEREAQVRIAELRTEADVRPMPSQTAERAEPIRDSVRDDEVFTRVPRSQRQVDQMSIPEHVKKPGMSYQWVTLTVLNQPVDRSEIADYESQGWRACKVMDYPELGFTESSQSSPIERRGMRLYERPLRLTNQATAEDTAAAYDQTAQRLQSAATGRGTNVGGELGEPMRRSRGVNVVPVELRISEEAPAR